jgi:plasmid stabilization system protein ParE
MKQRRECSTRSAARALLLAKSPSLGHSRRDLTNAPVLFWPVGAYLVIYHKDIRPVQIVAVLHGKRNVKKLLHQREMRPAGPR